MASNGAFWWLNDGTTRIQRRDPSRRVDSIPDWANWSDDQLLDLRMCDLQVGLEGSFYEKPIVQLQCELAARGLLFRPYVWISDEWFTPDGVPGIAVPFYLAHPRLAKLEATRCSRSRAGPRTGACAFCGMRPATPLKMPIASAVSAAGNRSLGAPRDPYPTYYSPGPTVGASCGISMCGMRKAIRMKTLRRPLRSGSHLIRPGPTGTRAGRCSRSCEYVDGLMAGLAAVPPKVVTREEIDPLPELKKTLREHYERKRKHYGIERPSLYDPDLKRLFSDAPAHADNMSAADAS